MLLKIFRHAPDTTAREEVLPAFSGIAFLSVFSRLLNIINMIPQRTKRKCIVMETDKNTLRNVREVARHWYEVLDTFSADQALQMLHSHGDVSIFITQHGSDHFDCIDL